MSTDLQAELDRLGAAAPGLDRFLRFAAERFSAALYWIAEDGGIIYASRRANQLTGYSIEELTSMKMYDLNVDLDITSWPAIWGLLKAAGQRDFEVRHRHRDGHILHMQVSAHFFAFEGKEYSCAFLSDVSERKELEGRLRQAEKMEAIGRLAGGVAHDFNNQLAGILGYAELLRATSDNPKQQRFVDELCATVKVASDLTAQLLAFSRRGKFLARPIDLHRLIADVAAMFSRSTDRRIRVVNVLEAERSWTVGDPSQLQSALLNLLLNARDAMPEGGTITVATANADFAAGASTSPPLDLEAGGYVVVSVRDTGVGMDAEMQAHIFEPFFTTKDVGAGTGLGLAAVYGTAKNHKGAIGVVSNPGGGSQFTLYLPVARSGAARREQSSDEPVSLRLHGHVVVVDDERVVRDSEAQMLEALGCTVATFADAESAIAYFEREHASVDLVLLDLVMPVMSGAEVFSALRRIDPNVQVLVVSGYSLDEQVQRLIEAGAEGFLQKPFGMAALAGRVRPLLRS